MKRKVPKLYHVISFWESSETIVEAKNRKEAIDRALKSEASDEVPSPTITYRAQLMTAKEARQSLEHDRVKEMIEDARRAGKEHRRRHAKRKK